MTTTNTTASEAGLVEMMTTRYSGKCRLCGAAIKVGRQIGYARTAKMTFCRACAALDDRADEIQALLSASPVAPARSVRETVEEREDRGDYSHHFHGR